MSDDQAQPPDAHSQYELRERAIERLKKRGEFRGHLLIYALVNAFLVVIWAVTSGTDGFFWPIFPIAGWGIGVAGHWYNTYRGGEFGEEAIRREMDRMDRTR